MLCDRLRSGDGSEHQTLIVLTSSLQHNELKRNKFDKWGFLPSPDGNSHFFDRCVQGTLHDA